MSAGSKQYSVPPHKSVCVCVCASIKLDLNQRKEKKERNKDTLLRTRIEQQVICLRVRVLNSKQIASNRTVKTEGKKKNGKI